MCHLLTSSSFFEIDWTTANAYRERVPEHECCFPFSQVTSHDVITSFIPCVMRLSNRQVFNVSMIIEVFVRDTMRLFI